jgi:hypothetical protein
MVWGDLKGEMQHHDGSDQPIKRAHSRLVQPHQYDVLLGRGKSNIRHPGNVVYQGTYKEVPVASKSSVWRGDI